MTVELNNSERLMQLYDPHYVRRIETINGGLPVQVCLETRMLHDTSGTGVATYARVLAGCLAAAGASPLALDDGRASDGMPRSRVVRWMAAARRLPRTGIAHQSCQDDAPAQWPTQWIVRDVFREAQVFYNLHGRLLPIALDRPPEVMHWTYPAPLFVVGAKNLYTIHDLIPLTHPKLTSIPRARHAGILAEIVRHAHLIVTVSETVRALVIEHLGVSAERVVNTMQAIDTPLQADPPLPDGLRSGRYFFFCGRVERRKNLELVAEALVASKSLLPLVIVGPGVDGEQPLEAALRTFPNVIRLPWVPRAELIGMMRRARALLFPSLAEGFGLPIAEAMTLGCPVLTSNRGAAAEVAANSALLVDPLDLNAVAQAIARLDGDDTLCARLRAAGFARGRQFTPDVYARRLRALYAGALGTEPADAKGAR